MFALSLVSACSGSCSSADSQPAVLVRISANAGLESLRPRQTVGGSAAAALDLIYDLPGEVVASAQQHGAVVELNLRPGYSAEQLAKSLDFDQLVGARAIGDHSIEVELADEATAALYASQRVGNFPIGPFRLDQEGPGWARLVARRPGPIDTLELRALSAGDEWRRIMARDIDVVPLAASLYRDQFVDLGSVRAIDLPATSDVVLYFRASDPVLGSLALRRELAHGIRRRPLAKLACGSEDCAAPAPPGGARTSLIDRDANPSWPATLGLLVARDDVGFERAAQVLAHQLGQLGIEVIAETLGTSELVRRVQSGDYQMALGPLTRSPDRYLFFASFSGQSGGQSGDQSGGQSGITGYADADYDAAVASADWLTAQAILDRDVPMTPLYQLRYFAVVDGSLCGDVEPSPNSWRWIADLAPCPPARLP